MKAGADWLAWGLQFAFGAGVGAVVGLALVTRRWGNRWLGDEQVPSFLLGAALLLGGLASLHGDRLWLGAATRVIPPDGIRHSGVSRWLSRAAIGAGGALAALAVAGHFGLPGA